MGDPVERLFQQWHRLGGAVLLAEIDPATPTSTPEQLIAETTAHCRDSGRLTWVALDWLINHVDEIDAGALLRATAEHGDLSVLGVLSDAARQRYPHPKFERLMRACMPREDVVPFFHRVARSPLASRLAAEEALPLYRRWNYLCNELRYLRDERRQPRDQDRLTNDQRSSRTEASALVDV